MTIDSASLKRRATRLWQRDELPREFAWMELLSPLHYRLCLVELHSAVAQAHVTGEWDPVARLVEDWEATARMDATPDVAAHVLSDGLKFDDYKD